jgi:hypothetical protein
MMEHMNHRRRSGLTNGLKTAFLLGTLVEVVTSAMTIPQRRPAVPDNSTNGSDLPPPSPRKPARTVHHASGTGNISIDQRHGPADPARHRDEGDQVRFANPPSVWACFLAATAAKSSSGRARTAYTRIPPISCRTSMR